MGLSIALHLLTAMRLLNVLHSPVQDCDEVFNYLEPLNFLTRGFGKQTWEYSPVYAIRSYSYLLPLTLVLRPITWLADSLSWFPSWWTFYLIRGIIALFTVYAEYQLYKSLKSTLSNKNVANWYLLFTLVSTGYSHGSVSLLPSNLAMNCVTLSTSYLVRFTRSRKTAHSLLSIKWLIIGTFWGWPFVAVSSVPLVSYILVIASKVMLSRFLLWSIVAVFFNLVMIMQIDYSFYHKTMVVPLNIVLYNVINTSDTKGPEIFGTEPLQYYINNLVLNFNLIAPLAYLGIVVIPLLSKLKRVNDTGLRAREIMVIIAGLPLWSFIFFQQPHKEERFLYPIYSLINVSAAFTIHYLVNSATALAELIGINTNFIKFIRKIGIYVVVFTISIFSILKTTSLAKNYNGFIEIYKHIPQPPSSDDDDYSQKIVCTGREWHHYPSSFFLPFNHRLQFTSSSFNGLLPGDFLESESIFNGVRNIPDGMNDMNIYDPSKITQLAECDYFVDIEEDVDSESNEVDFWKLANDKETLSDSLGQWELIHDVEVLDVKKSWGLLKLIWLPEPIRQLAGSKLGVVEYGRVGLFKRVA